MKVRKEWIGSKKASTKGDLADLQEDIHVDLQEIKDDGTSIKSDLASLKQGQVAILKVLQSIEGRLKDMTSHEQRLQRLEKAVFFKR